MADEQNQGTSQSSQGTAGQSSSDGSAATGTTSQGSTASQTTSTQTGQSGSQQQAAAPTRPDWLPETFFDAKAGPKWDDFGKHFSEVVTRDAAEQIRRTSLPQKPEDYKVGTSAAFKPPEGVEFKIDEANPLWAQARTWAQKTGLTQDQFHEAVDLFAGSQVADAATMKGAREAEVAKLGAAGPARVTNLSTFLDGHGVPELKGMLVTAGIVQAFEKLVSKFSSQGAASFSQAHREPGQTNGKVSDEQYNAMSPAQRLDYSRSFDQTQFQKSA